MKSFTTALAAASLSLVAATAAHAGDAAAGENDFKKCKSCHTIASADEVIYKGGKTGPNLYGVVGRAAGSVDFKFGADLMAAGEAGLVWSEEELIAYIQDPKKYLSDKLGKSAKSKMTFKLKDPTDVVAYLASVAPAMDDDGAEAADDAGENGENGNMNQNQEQNTEGQSN